MSDDTLLDLLDLMAEALTASFTGHPQRRHQALAANRVLAERMWPPVQAALSERDAELKGLREAADVWERASRAGSRLRADAEALRDGWRSRAEQAEAELDQRDTEIKRLKAEVRAAMSEQHADEIERISTERGALPEKERRRVEAGDAPLLRIQLASTAEKIERLKADKAMLELASGIAIRRAQSLAREVESLQRENVQLYTAWWSARIGRARDRAAGQAWRDNCLVIGGERDQAKAALAEVRRLCDLTIAVSIRVDAIDQARDTLAVLARSDLPAVREFVAKLDPRGEAT